MTPPASHSCWRTCSPQIWAVWIAALAFQPHNGHTVFPCTLSSFFMNPGGWTCLSSRSRQVCQAASLVQTLQGNSVITGKWKDLPQLVGSCDPVPIIGVALTVSVLPQLDRLSFHIQRVWGHRQSFSVKSQKGIRYTTNAMPLTQETLQIPSLPNSCSECLFGDFQYLLSRWPKEA